MRVTNSMMVNTAITNINRNKESMNKLSTQLSTKKKITVPSEDPVIAIRSLKLRSSLAELNQYYDKNIPDAISWLKITETALTQTEEILNDVYEQCNYGSNDGLELTDRQKILDSLIALKEQLYSQGNADYANRYVFTGYKTDSSLTFLTEEASTAYQITEKLSGDDLESIKVVTNELTVDKTSLPASVDDVVYPQSETIYRLRLSYDDLDAGTISISPALTGAITYTTYENGVVDDGSGTSPYPITEGMYDNLGADEVRYIPETGEVIFGSNVYQQVQSMDDISITYNKTGFSKGELKPEHYFDCVKNPGTADELTYTKTDQDIEYDISFNQSMNINIEGSSVFSPAIYQDVEDLIQIVQDAIEAAEKVSTIESMQKDSQYDGQSEILEAMLDAANKEKDLAEEKMKTAFSNGITKSQNYLNTVNLAITECGGRVSRLELTQDRVKEQITNFKELLSTNEDINYEDVAIQYNSAEAAYNASLMAAQSLSSVSLLDFLR